jgi:hypothetical protein
MEDEVHLESTVDNSDNDIDKSHGKNQFICSYGGGRAGPVNRDSFNKALIAALINIQNDI